MKEMNFRLTTRSGFKKSFLGHFAIIKKKKEEEDKKEEEVKEDEEDRAKLEVLLRTQTQTCSCEVSTRDDHSDTSLSQLLASQWLHRVQNPSATVSLP